MKHASHKAVNVMTLMFVEHNVTKGDTEKSKSPKSLQ